ncbi:MAG: hypothetical protein ACMG57_00270 [Candidatus Dojkabacteria bacterium]
MNEVFINSKGWVEVIWGHSIDAVGYVEAAGKMLDLITKIEDSNEEPLMIIDFTKLKKVTQEVIGLASSATRDLGCKKIAGFGIKPEFKVLLDTIKKLSKKADTIREFNSRDESEVWLEE